MTDVEGARPVRAAVLAGPGARVEIAEVGLALVHVHVGPAVVRAGLPGVERDVHGRLRTARSGAPVARQARTLWPVRAWPSTRVWTSLVPS